MFNLLHLRLSPSWQFKATEALSLSSDLLLPFPFPSTYFIQIAKEHLRMLSSPTPPPESFSFLLRLFSAGRSRGSPLCTSAQSVIFNPLLNPSIPLNLLSPQFSCIPNVLFCLLKHHTDCKRQRKSPSVSCLKADLAKSNKPITAFFSLQVSRLRVA